MECADVIKTQTRADHKTRPVTNKKNWSRVLFKGAGLHDALIS